MASAGFHFEDSNSHIEMLARSGILIINNNKLYGVKLDLKGSQEVLFSFLFKTQFNPLNISPLQTCMTSSYQRKYCTILDTLG